MHWTDTNGTRHNLPSINEVIRRRLKHWGVCDLLSVINQPEKWRELFEQLQSDGEFICNFAYALEHEELGSDAEQLAFGNLLCGGDAGSAPLLECSEALQQAVIDFFPGDRRAAIRQFFQMTQASQAAAALQRLGQDFPGTASDSKTPRNGSKA